MEKYTQNDVSFDEYSRKHNWLSERKQLGELGLESKIDSDSRIG